MTKDELIKTILTWKLSDDKMKVLKVTIPELAESEDVRIRKCLLSHFSRYQEDKIFLNGITMRQIVGWLEKQKTAEEALQYLKENHSPSEVSDFQTAMNIAVTKAYSKGYADGLEKQGVQKFVDKCKNCNNVKGCITCTDGDQYAHITEQKPTDKIEPKFNVGDWIVTPDNKVKQIEKVTFGNYWFTDESLYNIIDVDNKGHLWTIRDVKDGDVLCSNQIILLFRQWEPNSNCNFVIAHAGIDISGKLQITDGHWLISNESKLATQEQRDLLFSKMKEAGYEWDEKDKVLVEIKQKNVLEEAFDKSRKDYSLEEKKEASDYSESIIPTSIAYGESKEEYMLHKIIEAAFIAGQNTKQKSAWSKEDEVMLDNILNDEMYPLDIETMNWLKSLKDRMTWRPTEEQMETLGDAVKLYKTTHFDSYHVWGEHIIYKLETLYNDLKKL